jgi:hypothetical protein
MKRFILLMAIFGAVAVQAGDYEKKSADQLAAENLKAAKQMFQEAKNLEQAATTASPEDASVLNNFAKLTMEEAQWLQKGGEAFEKNQIRLGERHLEKARELCDKRGKLSHKIGKIFEKDCEAKGKEGETKTTKKEEPSKSDKIAELEKKQAELEAEKKKLLADDTAR